MGNYQFTKRDALILNFMKEIGQKEISGSGANPRIVEYLGTVDMPSDDEIPWCAAFINWIVKSIGLDGTGSALARSFLKWGSETESPLPGDIVVISRGDSPYLGHVGLYLDSNQGVVLIGGGNQFDRVGVNGYSRSRVLSFRTHPLLSKHVVSWDVNG